MHNRKSNACGTDGKNDTRRFMRALAILLCVAALIGGSVVMPALAESDDIPPAVVDPALTGTWGYHEPQYDVDLVFTFNADGTGTYYANGMEMPIASYVATTEPYTEYGEDGSLLTVYYGDITETMGDTTYTIELGSIEYGYKVTGDKLRIVFSRNIANNYTDYTRE